MIAGIDFSTKAVDVVLLDEDTDAATWHRFPLFGNDGFDRARNVREAVPNAGWWEDYGVLAVGIEDPRGYGAGSLYRVQGAILTKLPETLLVHPWVPSSWRKTVGLPGNANKDAIKDHVVWARLNEMKWRYGKDDVEIQDWPQDACDAYCIALATRTVLERVAA